MHEVEPPLAAAVVVLAEPVVVAPADLAHASSEVAAAAVLHVVPVDSVLAPVHDAFVVAAAVAEQLHVVAAAVAAAAELVLRRVRPVAVVVAQVVQHVRLAPLRDLLDAARSAGDVAPAPCVVVRVAQWQRHAAVEQVEPAAEQLVVTFVPFAVHRVPVARLSL